ncbi:MAG: TIR domain-containing protein [Candidatus Lokiarchaeota archaeon]|nr:TIR domain-containing protein [Candidatus Lokiarchaeota archaeon]
MDPLRILLTGEKGVGKTTIMNLLPGDTILKLDDDLNEIVQTSIELEGLGKAILIEISLEELVNNSKGYKSLLENSDTVIIVTNSATTNLQSTHKLYSELKQKVKISSFYIFANFQDKEQTAIEKEKIEEMFGEKTIALSAVKTESKEIMIGVIEEISKTVGLGKNILAFVSYATADSDFFEISKISEKLKKYPRIGDILYWEEALKDDIYDFMNNNIENCDIFLIFCSKTSKNSEPVQMEWKTALKIKKPIIPIFQIENTIPPLLSTKLGVQFKKEDIDDTIDQIYKLILKKLDLT